MRFLKLSLVLVASVSVFSQKLKGCNAADVTAAQEFADITQKNSGDTLGVWYGQDTLLNIKFCAGQISKSKYCANKSQHFQTFSLEMAFSGLKAGIDSPAEVAGYFERLETFRNICPSN